MLKFSTKTILFAILSAFLTVSYAQTERKVIITTAPEPKTVVVAPAGYKSCFTVSAGWVGDRWIPEHQVCTYDTTVTTTDQTAAKTTHEGVVWVAGYWACEKYTLETGACTDWAWVPGGWKKTVEVY